MAKVEKPRIRNFYIINVKLRNNFNSKDASPNDYANLFKRMFDKKIHAQSSYGKHCIIKTLVPHREDGTLLYYSGTLAQFTYIKNEKWLNLNSLDLDEEFKVPEGLFPDAVFTEYLFIPAAHRFIFRTASSISISPYPVKDFLEKALEEASKKDEYIHVDVEKDTASIKAIINAREIKKLIIDINYSNFDNVEDYQEFMEEDMKASNTSRMKIEATQKPDISIDVNKSIILKGAMETSVSNGETIAKVINQNGQTETIRTSEYPLREFVLSTLTSFNEKVYEKVMAIFRNNGNKTNRRKS